MAAGPLLDGPAREELLAFLASAGLSARDDPVRISAVTGGISSDVWHVETPRRHLCVKRALPALRVHSRWEAPVERNAHEWDYLLLAHRLVRGAVPEPIAHDPERQMLAMEWLPSPDYRCWKADLLAGQGHAPTARAVGTLLVRIHAATAANPAVAARFATGQLFEKLRIEPYFLATMEAHPDLRSPIVNAARRLKRTRLALVHGDVSPKNILVGPGGPVLLDAECAWFGDPAFDLAFLLNHLLLKEVAVAHAARDIRLCADAFLDSYLPRVDWEDAARLEERTATLLPILALARIDGRSPVEYLDESRRRRVRAAARGVLTRTPSGLRDTLALLAQHAGSAEIE